MLIAQQNVVRRRKLVEICQEMHQRGLVRGKAGNASARASSGVLITPSGIPYDEMKPSDIPQIDDDGQLVECELLGTCPHAPSSEWHLHTDLLRARPDMNAVLHTHPPFCTTLAVLEKSIPAIHYMIGIVDANEIPCAPYHTFGTDELSRAVVETMGDCRACLLAHHGLVVLAPDLEAAMTLTVEVESLAELYWRALAVGEPAVLDDAEMHRVREKFGRMNYGPQ